MDARIVGEIVGHRLVAVAQVAGAIGRVHHFHRREVTAFGGAVGGVDGQRVLNLGHVLLVDGQLAALLFVADQDGGAVGCFHARQIVEVGFIRGEDDVELGVFEVQPGEVALVVIVGEQGVGAQAQEVGESGVVSERGGVAQGLGHGLDEIPVLLVIGHGDKPAVGALDDGEGIVERGLVGGVLRDIGLQLRPREIVRVKFVAGRHGLDANERPILVDQVPAAAHDGEQAAELRVACGF